MKIALLTATFSHFSGIDRVVFGQAKQFKREGHEVKVVALESTMDIRDIPVLVLGMPRSSMLQRIYRLLFFFDRKKIKSTARKLKGYDSVVSHQYPMNLIARQAQKEFSVEYTYYNHGVAPPRVFNSVIEKVYIWIFVRLTNMSVRHADKVISISKYLQSVLQRETGCTSEVRYNSIDTNRFNPKVSGTAIRQKRGLSDRPVIVYIGRVSPHKGIHMLLEAFKLVLTDVPDAQLLVVGKETFPSYSEKLRTQAPASVHFVGFVPDQDLPQYYAAADVYATASMWEGFDLPIAEAAAMKKPVVAFDIGPHKEIITEKDTLVPPEDIQSFARALVNKLRK